MHARNTSSHIARNAAYVFTELPMHAASSVGRAIHGMTSSSGQAEARSQNSGVQNAQNASESANPDQSSGNETEVADQRPQGTQGGISEYVSVQVCCCILPE